MQTLENLLPREKLRGTPTAASSTYASGTLWPHGEWSFGWAKERPNGGEWHERPFLLCKRAEERIRDEWNLAAFPLDLSDVPNSCKWPRRGTKGMSGFGQQMVKAAGHLMEKQWPRHRKTLGTITLPPMSEEARREVVEVWPLLTRELLTWLNRRMRRLGLPQAIVSVTEIQPKRLAESSEGCLHWHLLWLNRPARSGHWSVCPNDLRSWLHGVLVRHCPSYDGGYVNVDTKKVEGTVAAYLAKYMSKGKQMVKEAMEDWGYGNCPRTWWNMSKLLRDAVKAATIKGREVGTALEDCVDLMFRHGADGVYAFLRPIILESSGVECTVGWRGRFEPEFDRRFRSVLEFCDIAEFKA